MDLNLKIIKAVEKCPLLYKTNASIAERQQGWRLIAEQMKIQEQFLKSRWHFLREHYLRECENEPRNGHFIYRKEMEFLLPYLKKRPNETKVPQKESLPHNIIQPEFIITEKDIENASDNEEFIFLEVETLEGHEDNKIKEEEHITTDELHDEQIDEFVKLSESETGITMEVEENEMNEERVNDIKEEDVKPAIYDLKRRKEPQELKTNIEMNSKEVEKPPAQTSNNERSEDMIFGELVAAMLKPMVEEKKRAIKKEIMNLLLT